ncbi:MAG: aminotransferase class V-fold PLP-dependent enzyme, partial [Pseudomonadota bacterium]
NGASLSKKFTPAGPDHAQVAACAGMVDYVDALAQHHGIAGGSAERAAGVHDMMRAHETQLLQPLLDYVADKNSVNLIGPSEAHSKAPTVAIDLPGSGEAAAAELAKHGIMTGGGDFYGSRPLKAMGVDLEKGVLRVSFVHYTTKAEVDQLLGALDAEL